MYFSLDCQGSGVGVLGRGDYYHDHDYDDGDGDGDMDGDGYRDGEPSATLARTFLHCNYVRL
jgi:hypothetical protein